VPGVDAGGEGGLLGITVARNFAQDPWVYAYFTASDDNRIVRMRYENGDLGRPQVLLSGIPKAGIHNGGRITFGPDGNLYAGTGDGSVRDRAQNRGSLGGKILRMTPDGKVPAGNPFPGSYVWSYGHRNVQGLAFDAQGRLWASEFGQNTWDELNRIVKGKNYGWPVVEGRGGDDRYVDPVAQWHTDEASPSGAAYAQGAIYLAALRGGRLWQIPVAGSDREPRAFFTGRYGRLRAVALAPDGSLWVMTNNTDGRGSPRSGDDKILRVVLR
jgi:glucose/arabinose dehydrogenase